MIESASGGRRMRRLEFWPDYGGVLLHEDGASAPLDSLGLPAGLIEESARWVALYDDAKLEHDTRDDAWIDEGRALFARVRAALGEHEIELVDWEGYWAAPPADAR